MAGAVEWGGAVGQPGAREWAVVGRAAVVGTAVAQVAEVLAFPEAIVEEGGSSLDSLQVDRKVADGSEVEEALERHAGSDSHPASARGTQR